MVMTPEFARAAQARLDLVRDKQRAVPVTEASHFRKVVLIGYKHPFPLNRLNDNSCHFVRRKIGFKGMPTPAAALLVMSGLIIFGQAINEASDWIRFWGMGIQLPIRTLQSGFQRPMI